MNSEVTVLKLIKWGKFLGSRLLGAEIRQEIESALDAGQNVVVDCDGVKMMSHSFADESIGKLAADIGLEVFRHQIRRRNVGPEVAPILRYVIGSRIAGGTAPKKAREG